MKITRLSRSAPADILDWIEEQLENRGIDAVVYTKYILSLLQDEDDDGDDLGDKNDNFSPSLFCELHSNAKFRSNGKENIRPSGKWRHKRYANVNSTNNSMNAQNALSQNCYYCWRDVGVPFNNNERKKLAVIEILKSATEQDIGLESFVDELCSKLRSVKMNLSSGSDSQELIGTENDSDTQVDNGSGASPLEQAQKYFAAFPALGCTSGEKNISKEIIIEMKQKREINKDWDGRRIAKTTECPVDDSSAQQTATASSTYSLGNSEEPSTKSKHTKTDHRFANHLNVMQDIFEDVDGGIIQSPLVNIQYEGPTKAATKIEDSEVFQKLFNKFNSSIASIWTDGNSNANFKPDNIWSFDSSFSTPQSSTPSPQPNFDLMKRDSNAVVDELISNLSTNNSQTVWELKANGSCHEKVQTTTLRNHKKDSLFVELLPKFPKSSSLKPCLGTQAMRSKVIINNETFEDREANENLLISPKTHFQPIKQDSVERESEDGTCMDIDSEVASLTICSAKCPNVKKDFIVNPPSDFRPVSTSLAELSLFMGPFNDEVAAEKLGVESDHFKKKTYQSENGIEIYEDKSTNTDNEVVDEYSSLAPIDELDVEPEYQDLCNMLNEVLKDGIKEEGNNFDLSKNRVESSFLDWCDEDNETFGRNAREQRLSWSCYKDAFNTEANETFSGGQQINEYKIGELYNNPSCGGVFNEIDTSYEQLNQAFNPNPYGRDNWFVQNDFCYLDDEKEKLSKAVFEMDKKEQNDCLWFENSFPTDDCNPLHLEMKSRNSEVTEKYEKPCSFFLEGNCKRSDCKYSHDLRKITCKFWREGFCFKSELCPFRHGFFPTDYEDDAVFRENPTFTIESEADFPTLALKEKHSLGRSDVVTDVNGKMPVVVFVKKKGKKRKDRHL